MQAQNSSQQVTWKTAYMYLQNMLKTKAFTFNNGVSLTIKSHKLAVKE